METVTPRAASCLTILLLPLLFALPFASGSEAWDSGDLAEGESWTLTFYQETSDEFFCKPHSPEAGFADFTGWVNVSDSADASAEDVTIYINDFSYEPRAVLIKPGASVTWTNNDSAVHTATQMVEEREEDSPGFGPGATVVALATALIVARRREGRR